MVVSEETLDQLLAQGAEGQHLDYKRECDLATKKAQVELARDIACMAAKGGHIVVGALDDGRPSGFVTAEHSGLLDEASVQQQMARWVPDGVHFRIGRHSKQDEFGKQMRFVLIAVEVHDLGIIVMKADGQYSDGPGPSKALFREGDVMGRVGTRNSRLTQYQVEKAFRDRVEREVDSRREQWRKDQAASMAAAMEAALLTGSASAPQVSEVTWQLPIENIQRAATEMLSRGQTEALRLMLVSTPKVLAPALTGDTPDLTLEELLDRVVTIAATAATLGNEDIYQQAVLALAKIYTAALDGSGNRRTDLAVQPTVVWRTVLERVEALGGLLVRLDRFDFIRSLVLAVSAGGEMDWYRNWLRHGLTETARCGGFTEQDNEGKKREVGLLQRSVEVVRRVDALHPDLDPEDEGILNSLCQFDAVAALVAMDEAQGAEGRYYYPNFASFYPQRTLPILLRVVNEPDLRSALGLANDGLLADSLDHMLRTAEKEAFPRPWDWEMTAIGAFIRAHGTPRP